jgi:RNA recognition motif-containing protein
MLSQCRFDRGSGASVFVSNIGLDATDESLAAMFAHLGTVESVKLGHKTDWGWG